jgi:hypothetical protein
MQKEDAGEGGLTIGTGCCGHNIVDRLFYPFTVFIRNDYGLIYEPCASAGNPLRMKKIIVQSIPGQRYQCDSVVT